MAGFRWNRGCKSVKNENRIVISHNCQWIKMSLECYDIINEAIIKNYSKEDLMVQFDDEGDKRYMEELVEKLFSFGALEDTSVEVEKQLSVYLVVTNRCNLSCAHCCVNANENKKDILSTKDILSIIDKLILLNPASITITGGEPLIRSDIYVILKYLSDRYTGKVFLMTNGLLIKKENVMNIVPYVHNIDLSIDGVNEETCKKIRGTGVFAGVLNAVDLLHNSGFYKISLSMVFGEHNNNLRERFIKLNEEYGTRPISREFTPLGRGKNNAYLFKRDVNSNVKVESCEMLRKEDKKNLYVGECGAVEDGFTIDYTGYIYPCSLLLKEKYILGNIMEIGNLKEWYEERNFNKDGIENFKNLIPAYNPHCKDCIVNIFCWDCLEEMDRLSENPELFQKRCDLKRKMLTNLVWFEEEKLYD